MAQSEDIIGLKIQALVNHPARAESDWHDIELLLRTAGDTGHVLDWDLISDYLRILGLESGLSAPKATDGPTH